MSTEQTETVFERVAGTISGWFEVPTEKIKVESDITGDLGLDSLDKAELALHLEEEFELAMPDDISDMETVGEIIVEIEKLIQANQDAEYAKKNPPPNGSLRR